MDAIFFCYKQPFATYKTLESFKINYPNGMVYLISDNGFDYSKMAEYFGYKYKHLDENICSKDQKNHSNEKKISDFTKYLDIFYNVLNTSTNEWIIKLEDDVKIFDNINMNDLESDGTLYGPLINKIPGRIFDILNNTTNSHSEYYTGHGGCIFNRIKFLECFNNKIIYNNLLNKYLSLKINETGIADDQFFSILIILNKKKICNNKYQIENQRKINFDKKNVKIQHQLKIYYNYDYKNIASNEEKKNMELFGFK